MEFNFLKQFPKRMKIVGNYVVLAKNSSLKTTWKQYGFDTFEEQINLIFALLLYIMEQSLKEEPCTMDDIGSFLDELNMTYFKKGLTYEDSKALGDFMINVILGDEGRAMYFQGFNFDKGEYEALHISFVANKVIYLEEDIKRTSYYLTDDGYNLLLATLEVEGNMKLTIHEMIFRLHLEKATYDKAVEEMKNIFNMLRIQVQKIKEAMRQIKQNVLNYSVLEYKELLDENLNTIEETKNRFMMYREKVMERVYKLEEDNINLNKFDEKDMENLYNLKIIEGYLNRALDEHQKILTTHFDMKSLYSKELESLSQMALIRRFDLNHDLFQPILDDVSNLDRMDLFLKALLHQEVEKTYNINLAFQKQVSLHRKEKAEEEELLDFDENKWQEELIKKKKEKLNQYYTCLEYILGLTFEAKRISLSEIKEQSEENLELLAPTIEIFKEVIIELIKTKDILIHDLTKERSEMIEDGLLEFQLNRAILELLEGHEGWNEINRIQIIRLEDEEPIVFDNLISETGTRKRIRCSNVVFEIE
ncbi:hypothetical protein [Anaeromicropila herbilytica]|uniref:Replicative DNA helicase n=1 Tax=Anaeromicropila herbilytica TaxID=2785025 RepID=A0A7R7ELZ2_9FIRM|nr:hypothetical protein [Anaeromicropila herbilytica]BCN31346.1 hypothetical protein bsdtb5_26410 [Anaeromicropila herbilytica]